LMPGRLSSVCLQRRLRRKCCPAGRKEIRHDIPLHIHLGLLAMSPEKLEYAMTVWPNL
jgi:hypothetical protein